MCDACGCDKHACTLNICNAREPQTNSIIIRVLMRVLYRSAQMWLTQMGFRMGSYEYKYNGTYTVYHIVTMLGYPGENNNKSVFSLKTIK